MRGRLDLFTNAVSHSLLFTRNTPTADIEWSQVLFTFNLGRIEKKLQRKGRSGIRRRCKLS